MAGTYADSPSRRMAYDKDGTVCRWQYAHYGYNEPITPANLAIQNNESDNYWSMGTNTSDQYQWFIFPELREFDGVFIAVTGSSQARDVGTSVDTSNGIDGAWVTQIGDFPNYSTQLPYHRDNIYSLAVPTIRGWRWRIDYGTYGRVQGVHAYGVISPGQTVDRILFLDSGAVTYVRPQDYGDVPQGSSRDILIKLKNNSSTLTATTVTIDTEDLYLGGSAWYSYSTDGINFTASKVLASLGPGAQQNVYVRQHIPSAASLGVYTARSFVTVGSWV